MPLAAVTCALGAWAAAVAGCDLLRRRVPNALIALLLAPALLALAVSGRGLLEISPLQSFVGLFAAGLPMLPGYALGQLGAGDVKFAASLGFLVGGPAAVELLLIGSLLLGLASAAVWLLRRTALVSVPQRIPATPAFAAAFGVQLAFGRLLNLGF